VAFERSGYTLYAREQRARGEKFQTIYFFSKRKPIVGTSVDLPDGYVVAIDRKTGIPYLRKK
jgi:hypothetical protein